MRPLLLLLAAGCAGPEPTTPPVSTGELLGAFTTVSARYDAGTLHTLSLTDEGYAQVAVASVSSDPVVFAQDDLLLQVNRFGTDTVRLYSPGDLSAPRREIAITSEIVPSTNPHAAVLCEGALFVSLYEEPRLAVYEPGSGIHTADVDLSAHDDGDGSVEASSLVVDGSSVWVGMQRLARGGDLWTDAGSIVARVDCATLEIVEHHPVGGNVLLSAHPRGGVLASARAHGEQEAGISWLRADRPVELLVDLSQLELEGHRVQPGAVVTDGRAALAILAPSDPLQTLYGLARVDLELGTATVVETLTGHSGTLALDRYGGAWFGVHALDDSFIPVLTGYQRYLLDGTLDTHGWLELDAIPYAIAMLP